MALEAGTLVDEKNGLVTDKLKKTTLLHYWSKQTNYYEI